jgi:hypothetical protein
MATVNPAQELASDLRVMVKLKRLDFINHQPLCHSLKPQNDNDE